jgi:exopolysaccharide biosynthesis protein
VRPRLPLFLTALIAAHACAQDGPIVVRELTRETPDGPARVFVAQINLADPRLEVVVTNPLPGTLAADGDGKVKHEASLTPTDEWAKANKLDLAVNANFFAKLGKGTESDVLGLSVSDGRVISPLRVFDNSPDPAIVFAKDRTARIALISETDLPGVWDAVAGIGASASERDRGGLLVEDGKNRGEQARVQPTVRHPRTAAGISADGHTLWVVVADGRQAGYSVGMTLPELADLMIELGVDDALNLDGGGSSAFVYHNSGGEWITNKPSDGVFRPVANHLGFKVAEATTSPAPSSDAGQK